MPGICKATGPVEQPIEQGLEKEIADLNDRLLFAVELWMLASVSRMRPAFENASLEVSRVLVSNDLRDRNQGDDGLDTSS